MRWKRLNMPRVLIRPGVMAGVLGFSMLGAAVVAPGPTGTAAEPASRQTAEVTLIYNKGRNFRIPIKINAEAQSRIKEVSLLVSEDLGFKWKAVSKTFPDHPAFSFRAKHDGEYWFAVQTLTVEGNVSPALDSTVEPNLKVVVDTVPPSLFLEADGRRASMASVRWEVKDQHLDLRSLVLEYQVEGVGVWRRVPIRRPVKLIGAQSWDAGTAEALKVRMSASDRAGNVTTEVIDLPEGTASPPDFASNELEDPSLPMVEQISSPAQPRITAGPNFTPVNDDELAPKPEPTPERAVRPRGRASTGPGRPRPTTPDWVRDPGPPPATASAATAASIPSQDSPDLFPMANGAASPGGFGAVPASTGGPANPGLPTASAPPPGRGGSASLLVESPKFKLQYAVDDAGPNGPATVELWITQDGGRTWIRRGDDPDRTSPIEVDLGGEGTYGISLVARSTSGLGDQPPAPGDPPQTWVEVELHAAGRSTGPGAGRHGRELRQGGDHLAGERSPSGPQVGRPLLAPGPGRCGLAALGRGSGEHRPLHLGGADHGADAVPYPGRGGGYRRPPRIGRDDRNRPGHRRSQPAAQPDHRPGPQRPRRDRAQRLAVALRLDFGHGSFLLSVQWPMTQSLSRKPQRPSRRVICEHRIRQSTPSLCSQSTLQRPSETVTNQRAPGVP